MPCTAKQLTAERLQYASEFASVAQKSHHVRRNRLLPMTKLCEIDGGKEAAEQLNHSSLGSGFYSGVNGRVQALEPWATLTPCSRLSHARVNLIRMLQARGSGAVRRVSPATSAATLGDVAVAESSRTRQHLTANQSPSRPVGVRPAAVRTLCGCSVWKPISL